MAATRPDVSVVIVSWNTRRLLLDCLTSLRAATHVATLQLVVVDNASGDGSADAVAASFPDVLLVRNDANLGFAAANNRGFAVATGRYLCLVNSDVVARDGVLDAMVAHLDAHPEVGLLAPRTLTGDGRVRQNCRRFPTLANAAGDSLWLRKLPRPLRIEGRTLPPETYDATHDAEVLSGCFLMVRREAFDQVGPLDEDFFFYAEDTDWCRRFHDAGWRLVYLADAEAVHFGGGSSAARPVAYQLAMERADHTYWRKHHPPGKRAAYVALRGAHHLVAALAWLPRALGRRDADAWLRARGHATCLVWLTTRIPLARPLSEG